LLIKTFWQSKKKDRLIATLDANVKSLTAKNEELQEELKKTAPLCRSRFPKTLWIWKVPQAGFIMLLN